MANSLCKLVPQTFKLPNPSSTSDFLESFRSDIHGTVIFVGQLTEIEYYNMHVIIKLPIDTVACSESFVLQALSRPKIKSYANGQSVK